MSLRPVEAGLVDRPDHPSLRGPGCSERSRQALVYGMLGGMVLGAVFRINTAYRAKLVGQEFIRAVGKSAFEHGMVIGAIGCGIFQLDCY